jgi:RHS repeat-associated protein
VNEAGQTVCSDSYFDFTGLTYSQTVSGTGTPTDIGTAGTNFYRTTYGYDAAGRQNRVLSPTGTITRTVTDALGRTISKWIGTTDTHSGTEWTPGTNTGNMMKIEDDVYDSGGVGDGNLTQVTQHVDNSSSDDRISQSLFDFEDRQVVSKSGMLFSGGSPYPAGETDGVHRPISFNVLDNMGETLRAYQFDGDTVALSDFATAALTDTIPTVDASKVRALTVNSFDDQGRTYRTEVFDIDQTSGTNGLSDASILALANLQSDTFFDHRGQTIATFSPGGQVAKSVYDGAGRVTTQYTTDGGAVNNSNTQKKDWTHAGSVSSDVLLTQTENTLDADGNTILTVSRDRFHDDATSSEGSLGTPSSGIHARVMYMASYFDAANRLTDSVNVGTNGGSSYTRPSAVPTASDTVLVTHTDYNGAGNAYLFTDPRGIYTQSFFDMLNRTVETINNSTLGSPAVGSQVTIQTFDGANHIITMTAEFPGTMTNNQVTQYVYGIGGTSGTNLFSNELITKEEFPNASTGVADTTAAGSVSFSYNLLGEQLTTTDQNGSVHTFTHDALGRVTLDAITTLGSGVDGSIRAHGTNFTAMGLPYQQTAYSDSAATTVANQIQNVYNGFGDLITQYQEHSGAVVTASSKKIQYAFAEGSGNSDRITSQTFNNGRILDYGYSSGIDTNISRASYIADDGGSSAGVHLEEYSYLGLGSVVKRAHPEPGVDQTLIGSGTGDGGDQYTGIDRFGRIIIQNWTNGTSSLDEYEYGYDRDGSVLFQKNDLSSVNSELYHLNAAVSGDNNSAYDNLNRQVAFRRGTLSASIYNSSTLDTVSSLSTAFANYQQTWNLDALGNWSTLAADGATAVTNHFNSRNEETQLGAANLTFDNNGNTTTDSAGNTYKYDAWNHIITVKDNGNTLLVTYAYDATTRRISAVSPGESTRDLYYDTQWRIIEEYYGGTLNDQNIFTVNGYIDDVVLVDHDDASGGSLGKTSSGLDQRLYGMQDGQHRTTGLISTGGAVVERYQYDPYGDIQKMSPTWGTVSTAYTWEFQWKGMRLQNRDDTYYMRNRDYSPVLGRFLQTDPTGYSDGANVYRGLQDDPVRLDDPAGTAANNSPISFSLEPSIQLPDPNYSTLSVWGLQYDILYNLPTGLKGCVSTQTVNRTVTFNAGITLKASISLVDSDVGSVHTGMNGVDFVSDYTFTPAKALAQRLGLNTVYKPVGPIDEVIFQADRTWNFYKPGQLLMTPLGGGKPRAYNSKTDYDGQWRTVFESWEGNNAAGAWVSNSIPFVDQRNNQTARSQAGKVKIKDISRATNATPVYSFEENDYIEEDWNATTGKWTVGGGVWFYGNSTLYLPVYGGSVTYPA